MSDLLERLDAIAEKQESMPILTNMISEQIKAFVTGGEYQLAVDLWRELSFISSNTVGGIDSAGIRLFANVTRLCQKDLIYATREAEDGRIMRKLHAVCSTALDNKTV